jgi:transcriptional regulator with XRE-family HTH domain
MSTDRNPALVALGNRIREKRKVRMISQEDFAAMVGLDRSYYGGIERGERNLTVLKLIMIANTLEAETSELFPSANEVEAMRQSQAELQSRNKR